MLFSAGVRCDCSYFVIHCFKCFDLSFLTLDPVLSKIKSLPRKRHEAALQSCVTTNEPYQVNELKLEQSLLATDWQSEIKHKVTFRKLSMLLARHLQVIKLFHFLTIFAHKVREGNWKNFLSASPRTRTVNAIAAICKVIKMHCCLKCLLSMRKQNHTKCLSTLAEEQWVKLNTARYTNIFI